MSIIATATSPAPQVQLPPLTDQASIATISTPDSQASAKATL